MVLPTRRRGCSLPQTSHSPEPGRCRLWLRPRSTPVGASQPPVGRHALHPTSRGTSALHSADHCCYTPDQLKKKRDEQKNPPKNIASSLCDLYFLFPYLFIIISLHLFLHRPPLHQLSGSETFPLSSKSCYWSGQNSVESTSVNNTKNRVQ